MHVFLWFVDGMAELLESVLLEIIDIYCVVSKSCSRVTGEGKTRIIYLKLTICSFSLLVVLAFIDLSNVGFGDSGGTLDEKGRVHVFRWFVA